MSIAPMQTRMTKKNQGLPFEYLYHQALWQSFQFTFAIPVLTEPILGLDSSLRL